MYCIVVATFFIACRTAGDADGTVNAFTRGRALRAVRFFAASTVLDDALVATFFIARRTAGDAVGTAKAFTCSGLLEASRVDTCFLECAPTSFLGVTSTSLSFVSL
jgi:hypothetical protein